jgi:uncharacterized protein
MRASSDIPRRLSLGSRRARWAIVIAVVVLIALIISAQRIASIYTDFLWFQSLGFTSVWTKTITVETGLAATFAVIFFGLLWGNLLLADRLAPAAPAPAGDELVTRWQELVAPHMTWVRVGVAGLLALIGGISAHSQWDNWLLFSNAAPYTSTSAPWDGLDPLNHMNDGFYVFRLPFLSWLAGWAFSALVVTLLLCLVAHYLNGGIRPHSAVQRVSPRVKAHLSVLLAALALVQGVNYYLERLSLVLSTKYVVDGATYTDVHAVRPALLLLIAISVIAAGLFLYNVRQQGWLLPIVAVALWALVWVLVANVYPALVQALVVNPAENVKEQPYITRNITATTEAYGLGNVSDQPFQGDSLVTASQVTGNSSEAMANAQNLANVRLLDPTIMGSTISKQQGFRGYFSMSGPSTDRYDLPSNDGNKTVETQVLISARDLNPSGVPGSWVNQHLQYTHGYGAVITPANQSGVDPSDGYPNYVLSGLPPAGEPSLGSQPRIYFDANPQSASGYVIANSAQPEIDYEDPTTDNEISTHYTGTGGVQTGGFFRRVAFAISFGDYNILISGQVTSQSRILYYRNVVQRLEKAAPFLSYDSDPYPVVANGSLYWVDDAYTTTDNFPYSEQANTNRLSGSSGLLDQPFNYVRNSVKAVVNAYTGQTWFFVQDPTDPIIQTYENAFPKLFTDMGKANSVIPGITDHWRYPEDLFTVQTNMYQTYHQQNASVFYAKSQAWSIPQNPASGEVGSATTTLPDLPGIGVPAPAPANQSVMPNYELMALPGESQQSFVLVQPFVPASNGDKQNLTAFLTASSDPSDYGQLTAFTIPASETVDGPYLVSTAVETNSSISQEITLLSQRGSKVVLGNVVMTPIGQSLLYIQPLYVESEQNGVPRLNDVVVVYNGTAYHSGSGDPSLAGALCQITNPSGGRPFNSYCSNTSPPTTSTQTTSPGSSSTATTTTTTPTTAPTTTGTTTSSSANSSSTSASSPPNTSLVLPTPHSSLGQDLAGAQQDFAAAKAALHQGDLATYQQDIAAGEALVAQADKLLNTSTTKTGTTTTGTTTTGTTTPGTTTTTTSPKTRKTSKV